MSSRELDLQAMLAMLTAEGPTPEAVTELLLSSVSDGVAITNATGDRLYFNAAGRRIMGIAEGQRTDVVTQGADLSYLHDFSPVAKDQIPLVRALRGEDTNGVELFVQNPALADGALVSLNARPLHAPDGRVVGGIAIFHDIGARKQAEEELRKANSKLGEWVSELEHRAQVTWHTNEMAELLQSSRTMDEFHVVVSRYASRIFENESGAVYVVNPSRSAIELVVRWGEWDPKGATVFAPDGCWALRRGRMHRSGGDALGPDCDHATSSSSEAYVCMPMMGQGEALGILHVRQSGEAATTKSELSAAVAESRVRTIISVAEHVALALANLRLRDTLRMQAIRDPLTGLFNRRHMEESLERELSRAARANGTVAAVMIDIDHFKRYNDTFGHAAADVVLRDTAALLRSRIRPEDIACRFGGEELVLILPEMNVMDAVGCAERLRSAIGEQQVHYRGVPLAGITASFGVAAYPAGGTTVEALLRASDEALYGAKHRGRNRVCWRDQSGGIEDLQQTRSASDPSSARPVAADVRSSEPTLKTA
ncbi:MAG: diguanylate cyclase [Polyangiaceae bacterium]